MAQTENSVPFGRQMRGLETMQDSSGWTYCYINCLRSSTYAHALCGIVAEPACQEEQGREQEKKKVQEKKEKGERTILKYEKRTGLIGFFSSICQWKININYVHELNGCLSPILQKQLWGRILVLRLMVTPSMSVQFIGKWNLLNYF